MVKNKKKKHKRKKPAHLPRISSRIIVAKKNEKRKIKFETKVPYCGKKLYSDPYAPRGNKREIKKLAKIRSSSPPQLRKQVRNLEFVFNPKNVAIVGASAKPSKIGHAILRNFMQGGFSGKIYPINIHEEEILGKKCYKKISDVNEKIDCAVIAIPAKYVYDVLKDAISAGVPSAVVISGGFSEVGNREGEEKIKKLADENNMALIGPNCMGVLNPATKNDSVFLPIHKLGRPQVGTISFISQSGAVGGCIVDLASKWGVGISKFVSYGNAASINETDLINFLSQDEDTHSIISYIEGVDDGRKFMNSISYLTLHKPFVALKAGKSKLGSEATASHTGSMAGSYQIFSSALKQSGGIEAETLDELFELAKIFELPKFFGSRIAVLTNGGGNGVLAADAIELNYMELATFSPSTLRQLKEFLPSTTNIRNPLDVIGDADAKRYERALNILVEDENVDAIVAIVLFQTAALDSSIVQVLARAAHSSKKPIVVVSTGGEYTELQCKILDDYGIPTYSSPSNAINALAKAQKYNIYCHIKRFE
ncbi:MAG: CoA-binding protein [Candidatus Micrarchaeota archaeon]